MNAFEAYATFVAVKRHFTPGSSYDFHKYRGRTNVKPSSFEGRNDRYFYEKLGRKRDVVGFLVANLSVNPKMWIGDLFSPEADDRYEQWCAITESITYNVAQQLGKIELAFNDLFIFKNGDHAPIIRMAMAGKVSPEVLAVLDSLLNFTKTWEKYSWDPTVRGVIHLTRKLKGFVPFDRAVISNTLKKIFSKEAA